MSARTAQGNDLTPLGVDWTTLKAYLSGAWEVRLWLEADEYVAGEPDYFVLWIHLPRRGEFFALLDLVTRLEAKGRELATDDTHLHGAESVQLGLDALYAIARAVMEHADVDRILVQGGVRTSGARPGHAPRRFRFRRGGGPAPAPGPAGKPPRP